MGEELAVCKRNEFNYRNPKMGDPPLWSLSANTVYK